MIAASAALAFERLKDLSPLKELPVLTSDQEVDLEYVDSIIEGAFYNHFTGAMLAIPVPAQFVAVIETLKRRYEDGGWSVGVFPRLDGEVVREILLVFAPAVAVSVPDLREDAPALPPIAVTQCEVAPPQHLRLLVRMPTRGRPAQALRVLELYRELAGCPITIEVVIDEDDQTMMDSAVLQRLNALGCVITVGQHKSKVAAVNGGRVSEWDVLLLASDDMVPVAQSYAVEVLRAMTEHWPHLDGAIFYDDLYAHARCCTLPVIGRRFWEQMGGIYDNAYRSLCCDVEQIELWTALGRLVYVDKCIIEHRHPAARKAPADALYDRNDALHGADLEIYQQRKDKIRPHSQFRFDSPPLWLSVCIATIPERKAQLERLLDHLWAQILRDAPREVEILVDSGDGTIGEKRQRLIERAKGHFVAHVDDDDFVSHDYIVRIVGALRNNSTVDCLALRGSMTTFGSMPQVFEHSIKHTEWKSERGTHYRPPNHLNPVKRELALQVGFPSLATAEDLDFSMRLRPLLKIEASIGDTPVYHYWYTPQGIGV